jgi:hypothetical protein
MLVGHYEMLAMLLETRGVEPEPSAVARLHPRAAEVAEALAGYRAGARVSTGP